jgi:hypothetical protein
LTDDHRLIAAPDRSPRSWQVRALLAAIIVVAAGIDANLVPTLNNWRRVDRASRISAVEERDRLYQQLLPWLPPAGQVGYIPAPDWPSAAAVQDFYLASYALAPRRVIVGTDPEFVIVTPAASIEADTDLSAPESKDPRLAGFLLVKAVAPGARLFRRVR